MVGGYGELVWKHACPAFFYAAIQIVPSVFLVASSLVSAFAKAGAGEGLHGNEAKVLE